MLLRMPVIVAFAAMAMAIQAQTPLLQDPRLPGLKSQAVQYLYPDQVTLSASKLSSVELHFRIAPGLHINSHSPKEKYLIPTELTLPDGSGVWLEGASYPDGADFVMPADPSTTLSVYTDEFTISARFVAAPGEHQVQALLHFQACDDNACMPPKTITASIDVIGQ